MKKRVIIFVVCVVLILIGMVAALAGCDEYVKEVEPDSVVPFVILKFGDYRIITDTETGVEYLQYVTSVGTAITPLYNADGTLKVYKEEQE